jgi:hypothetical protein
MTTSEGRVDRLQVAIVRLCELMQRNERAFPNHWTELELIKQFARGLLDRPGDKPAKPEVRP